MSRKNLLRGFGAPGEPGGNWRKQTALFLSSQTISLFGSSLVQFAIIWYITLRTGSGLMMTISTLCSFVPQILISPFAGVWADRYERKWLIIFSDSAIALSTVALIVFFLLGHGSTPLLFIASAIRSAGAGVQSPAVQALIPQIVPQDRLMKVNGINSSIQSLVVLLSPAASGALLTVVSLESTFFVDVITAAAGVGILLGLQVPLHRKAAENENGGYFEDLKQGFGYARHNYLFRWFFVFTALFFFLIVPASQLTPLMVARTFGKEVWKLTANEVLFSAGSVLGGVAVASWGGFSSRMRTIALSCIAAGAATALLGVSSVFALYLLLIFLAGVSMPFFSTSCTVLLQEKVENNMQGRVFGMAQIVISSAMPLGMLVFGPLADRVSIELLLVVTGVSIALLGMVLYGNKRLYQESFPNTRAMAEAAE